MQISSINSTNFQSRKPQIRELDKALHVINREFPAISTSRYIKSKYVKSCAKIKAAFDKISNKFTNKRWDYSPTFDAEPMKLYNTVAEGVKNYKVANCAELTTLAKLVLGINGVESHKARLYSCTDAKDLLFDHMVLIIPEKGKNFDSTQLRTTPLSKQKDFYIFDPWYGFVDTPRNAAIKYDAEAKNLVLGNMHHIYLESAGDKKPHSCISLDIRKYPN